MKCLVSFTCFLLVAGGLYAEIPATFEAFCFKCHDATQAEGDLDLEDFLAKKLEPGHVSALEEIMLRIEEGDMPPKESRQQPTASEREAMIAWARGQMETMAQATMDDAGEVMMARLTRKEYRNVVRDLSGGIVLRAGEMLPNEGGAGEGFSNVGAAQGMGVAQFEKYIEAAKGALRHLRVYPHHGLVWSALPHEPVENVAAQIEEVRNEMISWHVAQQQKWGAEHRDALAARHGSAHSVYLEAAWRAKHGRAPVAEPFSPVALEKWMAILNDASPDSPFADWAKAWQAMPAAMSDEKLRAECLAIATGRRGGSTEMNKEDYAPPYEISFHETREEVLDAATKHGHWPFRIDIGDAKELFLIVTDAGDGGRGEYAVWQKGRVVFKDGSAKPWQEAVQIVGANSGKPFAWGEDGEGSRSLGPDAIGVRPPGALKFAVPQDAIVFEVDLTLDKNRTKLASIQALVLNEKPKSQSHIPGRFVFGGRKREADVVQKGNKEREQLLRKRNLSEANLTKVGLNAERNIFADWQRTPLAAIGGPWPDHTADKQEKEAPYHYTVAEVRRNATPEDLAELRVLEDRLASLTQGKPLRVEGLEEFATHAWRRPLTGSEIESLQKLYADAATTEVSFDSAAKVPLLAVLMSPNFIYRDPSDLRSRLSFFLWASIPDNKLLIADLTLPGALKAQALRMLRDPRARSLTTDFAAQVWQFEDFESFTGPDEKRFPEFTAQRRREMLDEVHGALNRVLMQDEPLTRLLDEDCLATKPLFLTKTSLPLRTSPVQRGAWVVETLLGRRIPPPPPVPAISEDETDASGLNIRQQLEKHRAEASCASCHAKIDPPGLALEAFDPIGRPRKAVHDPADIIQGVDGLKQWLAGRREEFIRNFHRKLLGYALGRAVLPGDQRLLECMRGQETFSGMVVEIVASPQFNMRRAMNPPAPAGGKQAPVEAQ